MIKKVAIVWESETGGGVNSYLKYLLSTKQFKNKDITIITNQNNLGAKPLKYDLRNLKNIKFEFFSSFFVKKRNLIIKSLLYFFKPIFLIISVFKFKKILNKKYDLLICQCGNYGTFRSEQAGLFAGKILNIPLRFLVIHHACEKPQRFLEIFHFIVNICIRRSISGIITVSKATLKTVKRNSNIFDKDIPKSKIIHNGVPKINNLKKKKSRKSIIKVILISRLVESKGHDILIKGVKSLPSKITKYFVFDIIGKGDENYKSSLVKLVKKYKLKNIKFKGYVSGESQNIISEYDLFISLTKDFEGFGLSVAEAMSVGVPVISTNVGAINEFCNYKNTTLIKPNSPKQLEKSLQFFFKKKKLFYRKSRIAQKKINKKFSNEIMGKNYFEFFKKIKSY